MKLGVNVDHIATLREARKTLYPDPVLAALIAEYAGCNSIVVHLREDRRHIKEKDGLFIKEALGIPLNLEMSVNKNIVDFALNLKPYQATLVPEKRQELTTEGGLNLLKNFQKVEKTIERLRKANIKVSLFIDPSKKQVKLAGKLGADSVEINTGKFSDSKTTISSKKELKKIKEAAAYAKKQRFFVAAGHGIDYENVKQIIKIKEIEELNIGHSIISRSVFIGLVASIEEMLSLIRSK